MNTFVIISRFLFFVNQFLMKKTELSYNSALKKIKTLQEVCPSLQSKLITIMITYTLYIYIILFNFCQAYFLFNKKCWITFISSIYPIFTFTVDYRSTIIRRFSVFYRIFHNTSTCFSISYFASYCQCVFCHKMKKQDLLQPYFFGVFNYAT